MTPRTALVTGGGRGIGRGIVLELARRGWNVTFSYLSRAAAATETVALCEEFDVQVQPVQADIGNAADRDPLVGVARQVTASAQIKARFPDMLFTGSAYSYLQEWLPAVAQAVVRKEMIDLVGLGRSVLSYPELSLDVLQGRRIQTKHLCRTFSDCTTGPRNSLISGCYPLDPYYKNLPEAKTLAKIKHD